MQLSELVAYRRHLDEITMQGGEDYVRLAVDPVVHSVINSVSPRTNHVSAVQQARDLVLAGLREFEQALAGIKHDVDQEIEQHQPAYLARSYGLYEDMQKGDSI
jgi:HD superfamily phosphohydrolase YqeK